MGLSGDFLIQKLHREKKSRRINARFKQQKQSHSDFTSEEVLKINEYIAQLMRDGRPMFLPERCLRCCLFLEEKKYRLQK